MKKKPTPKPSKASTQQRRKRMRDLGAAGTAEAITMLYCPEGHRLPHYTGKGQCTAVYCIEPGSKRQLSAEEKKMEEALVTAEASDPDAAESTRVELAERRLRYKLQKLGVPDTEDTAAIEEWADKKMVQMLKTAVAEVDARLRWGNDSERWEAAQQVLSSTGRKSREGGIGGAAPIIIINGSGGGPDNLPWVQRVAPIGSSEATALASKKEPSK